MKKRILSLLLLLTLVLTLSAAAWADTERFVFDESGYIADGDEEILEDLGATIRANTGVAVCICLTNDTPEDVRAYAADFYDSRIGDGEGIVIIHNPVSGVLAYYFIGEQLQGIGEEELTKIFYEVSEQIYKATNPGGQPGGFDPGAQGGFTGDVSGGPAGGQPGGDGYYDAPYTDVNE